jgi:hypothetical protein
VEGCCGTLRLQLATGRLQPARGGEGYLDVLGSGDGVLSAHNRASMPRKRRGVAPLQSNNHDTMAGHNDGRGEVLLLSTPAKVEGGDGHDSGSGLSAAVEHHGTTAGLRQEQRQEINGGEKGQRWHVGSPTGWCPGEVQRR